MKAQPVATPAQPATHGIGVSANASTQYNVAVGGTDFSDVLNGTTSHLLEPDQHRNLRLGDVLYPRNSVERLVRGQLDHAKYNGYSTAMARAVFATASPIHLWFYYVVVAAGAEVQATAPRECLPPLGFPTAVVRDTPSPPGRPDSPASRTTACATSPTFPCSLRTAPSGDTIPWFAFPTCQMAGSPCRGAPSNWAGFGGTSIATPEMAGIQALVNQNAGGKQGNPNFVYYALATSEHPACSIASPRETSM
jgi:hypothetical protein